MREVWTWQSKDKNVAQVCDENKEIWILANVLKIWINGIDGKCLLVTSKMPEYYKAYKMWWMDLFLRTGFKETWST